MKPRISVLVWPLLAHAAAWAAFAWIAFWPFAYRGVSTQPVPRGSGQAPQVIHYSASFIEVNGIWALLPLLVPVVLTALALLAVLYWGPRPWPRSLVLWVLAVLSIAFCVLGMLSFGILFAPAALALVITAIAGTFQAPHLSEPDGPALG